MLTILVEGAAFVVLVAALAGLLFYLVVSHTPLGTWVSQTRNRRRIERDAERTCPVHGPHDERELVRLPSGDRICPECFKEVVDGRLD